MTDIILGILIGTGVIMVIRKRRRDKKAGKSGCCGSCLSCGASGKHLKSECEQIKNSGQNKPTRQ
ncbi:MAG: FeoB-associated Cys-rich membrane protein [Lachnospiraceae bacterium]|jgi:hypothetical protein|nr:FeoB-associated Cys-rich membrane protein [Lachnospiraceae bacterium]